MKQITGPRGHGRPLREAERLARRLLLNAAEVIHVTRPVSVSRNDGLTRIFLRTLGRIGVGMKELFQGDYASAPLEMHARVIPGRRILCGDCGPAELLDDGCCASCGGHAWTHLRHVTLPWERRTATQDTGAAVVRFPIGERPYQVLQERRAARLGRVTRAL